MVTAQIPTQHSNIVSSDSSSTGFTLLCESFEVARIKRPDEYVESYYSFAGRDVCTRIVGRELAAAHERAFAPRALTTRSLAPALTIDLWDESVTGVPYPHLLNIDHKSHPQTAEGDWQYVDESGRWIWGEKAGSASWLDLKANRIVGWRACEAKLPKHERSKPLASLLPWWFYHQGIDILHAGMVARNSKGLLITGQSGIGKSTTTLYCMQAGFSCLSDDHIAVRQEGEAGSFIAHSIYQSARFYSDELHRFPHLQSHIIADDELHDPKALIFLAEAWPGRVLDQSKIGAIALARRSDKPQTCFQRATRGEAFKYLWLNSLVTPLGIGRARFEHITQLAGSAPCYWLDLGHDLALIPSGIEQLIEEIS